MDSVQGERKWVYMQWMDGWYRRARKRLGVLQLLFLFGIPLLSWNGVPLARIDFAARRVFLAGTVFTASDTLLLMLIALMAGFGLFFFTSLYGRLFCGYVCPQTVFLHDFVHPIERFFEGDRNARKRRDERGQGWDKWGRKLGKWASFLAVALLVSTAFMSWFSGPGIWIGQGGPAEYSLVAVFGAFWFADFAWFREQACNYLCPYARFQGALCDDETWVIGYDTNRGEPRGKAAREVGGCIDCNKCVVVCPQGIDIRDGFQMECIQCGYCSDACESVMDKLGYPSLVQYSTQQVMEGGEKPRWVRARTVVYGGLLAVLLGLFVTSVAGKQPFEVQLARAPGTLFQLDDDGFVRNTYVMTVTNIGSADMVYQVHVEGIPDAQLVLPELSLQPLESRTIPLVIRVPAAGIGDTLNFDLQITGGGKRVDKPMTFKGPHA